MSVMEGLNLQKFSWNWYEASIIQIWLIMLISSKATARDPFLMLSLNEAGQLSYTDTFFKKVFLVQNSLFVFPLSCSGGMVKKKGILYLNGCNFGRFVLAGWLKLCSIIFK